MSTRLNYTPYLKEQLKTLDSDVASEILNKFDPSKMSMLKQFINREVAKSLFILILWTKNSIIKLMATVGQIMADVSHRHPLTLSFSKRIMMSLQALKKAKKKQVLSLKKQYLKLWTMSLRNQKNHRFQCNIQALKMRTKCQIYIEKKWNIALVLYAQNSALMTAYAAIIVIIGITMNVSN